MRLKLLLAILPASLMIFMAGPAALVSAAVFNPLGNACGKSTDGSTGATGDICTSNKAQNGQTTDPAVTKIRATANAFALITGAAAVLVIAYSAVVFATAGGAASGQRAGDNPARAKTARSALTGAVIGLFIVALAWTIVTFVATRIIKT